MIPAFSFTMAELEDGVWYIRWNMLWAYISREWYEN